MTDSSVEYPSGKPKKCKSCVFSLILFFLVAISLGPVAMGLVSGSFTWSIITIVAELTIIIVLFKLDDRYNWSKNALKKLKV
ncbi:hypothetical protein KC865_01680 [Candidatus Kaiserbacteria bacterium]|nr:hypothetical protein [Candidatus Kaiserbacteria bacterium]USN92003.1 MAG: hypothetical protein H6782_03955 [Candidatus Nomurabacteria bacterium]